MTHNREYYLANRDRLLAQQAAYRAANREKIYAQQKEYRLRNRVAISHRNRKKKYGILPDDLHRMIEAQGGKCPICRLDLDPTGYRKIHIDHDHATGKLRGVLCSNCNLGIGHLREDPERMLRAINYLELHS